MFLFLKFSFYLLGILPVTNSGNRICSQENSRCYPAKKTVLVYTKGHLHHDVIKKVIISTSILQCANQRLIPKPTRRSHKKYLLIEWILILFLCPFADTISNLHSCGASHRSRKWNWILPAILVFFFFFLHYCQTEADLLNNLWTNRNYFLF